MAGGIRENNNMRKGKMGRRRERWKTTERGGAKSYVWILLSQGVVHKSSGDGRGEKFDVHIRGKCTGRTE